MLLFFQHNKIHNYFSCLSIFIYEEIFFVQILLFMERIYLYRLYSFNFVGQLVISITILEIILEISLQFHSIALTSPVVYNITLPPLFSFSNHSLKIVKMFSELKLYFEILVIKHLFLIKKNKKVNILPNLIINLIHVRYILSANTGPNIIYTYMYVFYFFLILIIIVIYNIFLT